jgi:hypothetical protein
LWTNWAFTICSSFISECVPSSENSHKTGMCSSWEIFIYLWCLGGWHVCTNGEGEGHLTLRWQNMGHALCVFSHLLCSACSDLIWTLALSSSISSWDTLSVACR